jgi:hypothetical protein
LATLAGATASAQGCAPCPEGQRSKGGDTTECALADNASLASLDIEEGTLTPGFAPGEHTFSVTVGWLDTSITLTPVVADELAMVTINGLEAQSGRATPISVDYGETPVSVTVLAPSGDTETYDVVVTRRAEATTLFDPNPRGEVGFGTVMARDGDHLVTGAPEAEWCPPAVETEDGETDNPPCVETGLVHLYAREGGRWNLTTSLSSGEPVAGQRLGASVALSDGRLVVGAPGAGVVHIFESESGEWRPTARLAPSGARRTGFGHSVALDGDTIVVGAPSDASCATGVDGDETDTGCEAAGAVYVFEADDEGWRHAAYLKGAVAHPGDGFGDVLALEGDRLLVSAPGSASCASGVDAEPGDTGCKSAGLVTVFDGYDGAWALDGVIAAPISHAGARFGSSISLSVDMLAVGAVGDALCEGGALASDACALGGAVHLYRLVRGGWVHQVRLEGERTMRGDRFGDAVAVGSELVMVGVTGEDDCGRGVDGEQSSGGTCQEAGAVVVFRPLDGSWRPVLRLQTPADEDDRRPAIHRGFGGFLDLDGHTVLVGAPGAETVTVFE